MIPLLWLVLAPCAAAWPGDGEWVPLDAGGGPMSDVAGDDTDGDGSLDLVDGPVLGWFADAQTVFWRLTIASDPTDGPDLQDQIWAVLIEADGDDAFDFLVASEGAAGTLNIYANNGAPGVQPGFANYTFVGSYGDLTGGAVRTLPGANAHHVDLQVSRADLVADLGVGDAAALRLAAAAGPNVYVDWADVADCNGQCADLDDALSDPVSIDLDGDGLTEPEEVHLGTDPTDADSDDDGLDDDVEPATDTDGDGANDNVDCDSDDDGISDGTEAGVTSPGSDTDAGGGCFVADADPAETTDPQNPDSDAGGLEDGDEDRNRNGALDLPWETDPSDPTDDLDTDGDNIADVLELLGDDAAVDDEDSDGDGIADLIEGLDDHDGDGVPSFLDDDSDGDGYGDAVETDVDTDGDGIGDYSDTDSDGDGLDDDREPDQDSDGDGLDDRLDPDSDDDGIADGVEGDDDWDEDGLPDFLDDDTDGDGLSDADEGSDDQDGDGVGNWRDDDSDGDGIPDSDEGMEDIDQDGTPNFLDTNSDGQGGSDRNEGVGDEDCDGLLDYLDDDHEDSFCGDAQTDPEVTDSEAGKPGVRGLLDNGGEFTGGACSTAPVAPWWLLIAIAALASHRRKLAVIAVLLPGSAAAQEVNAQRFSPSVHSSDLVVVDDAQVAPAGTLRVGIWAGHADDPLVYRPRAREEIAVLDSVTTADLTGAWSLGFASLGLDVPLHLSTSGIGIDRPTHLGDVLLVGKGRIAGGDHWDVGPHLGVSLPTGSEQAYVGAARARVSGGALASARSDHLLGAAEIGVISGTNSEIGSLRVTPAVTWGAGGAYRLADPLQATLELTGEHWLANPGFAGANPVEWLASFRLQSSAAVALTVGGGSGLTSGVGAPDFRVVGGLDLVKTPD